MNLHFDVRDIFRAPRLALSGKKIWIFLVANVIGYVAYFILNYIALALSGQPFGETWASQGLYPCLYGNDAPWYAWVLFWGGVIDWLIAIHLACTAVARVTYKQLKGDEFYSSGDAWRFVKKHWHPVVFTSISMALILVFFIGMAALFALFGKIPFVGEFLFALPYLLYFFGAVFTVYTSVVFLVSFIYTPAIVGTIEEDTMGAVFNSYSVTWSQPWRVIAYHGVLLPLAAISVGVFKLVMLYGFKLVNLVFGHEMLMGQKLTNIVGSAANAIWPQDLFNSIVAACSTSGSCCGTCLIGSNALDDFYTCFIPAAPGSLSGTECIAAVIVGIFIFLITMSFFSYFLSILSVGETIMFTIFRKKSDDDNILERKDEEELEDEEDEDEDEAFDLDGKESDSTSDDEPSTED
ncbi:MAG: hypothetical protein HOA15_07255 [Candidatus Marinimicrobia bacterium]|nr:hypothetical protein [Candidatus Neomarinimicrobiota bacterium]MBT3763013.1 hypothetical protein [Candidatus Neomarinimicrobiota bacterium]MBT4068654.1 hypothetical protein [Candidatus Neomarinimicrobiota bacterium]MBT4270757.1 hypothetical protein [Candidatus Neomarinimicrobiota bacterium]MBT4372951.1 hypothetical protein [Candidatus Neomarinimicrobiota bacterium]